MENRRIEDVLLESAASMFQGNDSIDRSDIDAVIVSSNDNAKYLAPILSEMAGIRPGAAHSVESMCSSGTNAIVSAYSYVASGLYRMVLVCGAETHDSPGGILWWDQSRGEFKSPIFWGSILARAYKRRYGISDERLSIVPVKNHNQARDNPNALHHMECTIRDVMESRKITEDLRLLDCSRSCTGGACMLVASEGVMSDMNRDPVWITGVGQSTTSAGFAKGGTFHEIESTRIASRAALDMAGREPRDIDVMEVHDAFSVCEVMALESMGIAEYGCGTDLARVMYETGSRRINPRGGLIGMGHPLGATGVAQAAEIVQQLRCEAGARQADHARTGMVHNMSAAGTSSTVLVMEYDT